MPEKAIATPVPAATILVLRDGQLNAQRPLEVFMVVRHHQIDFASGALVFPGGKVDKEDFADDLSARCIGIEGKPSEKIAVEIAAIREAYEESGILYAYPKGDVDLIDGDRLDQLEPQRDKLNDKSLTFNQFVEEQDLMLACDRLTPFAHWVTPAMMPKRFDTYFYIASAPVGHFGGHDGGESVDSVWINPLDAIDEANEGKRTVIFPTRLNLELLGNSASVDEAVAAASGRKIVTVEPKVVEVDGQSRLRIPAEAGYSVTDEVIGPNT